MESLIIFVKNPVPGKVKTRIAATLGDEQAANIYKILLEKTKAVVTGLHCKKYVYYADWVEENDLWSGGDFEKRLQTDGDLGERMRAAFKEVFDENDGTAIIIGSDCYDLSQKILENAFSSLIYNDAVLGPATDGGYYLLGLKELIEPIFELKEWSSPTLCNSTFYALKDQFKEVVMLTELSDVDEEKDVQFSY